MFVTYLLGVLLQLHVLYKVYVIVLFTVSTYYQEVELLSDLFTFHPWAYILAFYCGTVY